MAKKRTITIVKEELLRQGKVYYDAGMLLTCVGVIIAVVEAMTNKK